MSGGLAVEELLKIFKQLEELDGLELRNAMVHGRK